MTTLELLRLGSFGKVKPGAPSGTCGEEFDLGGAGIRMGLWTVCSMALGSMSKGKLGKSAAKSRGKFGNEKSPGNLCSAGPVCGLARGGTGRRGGLTAPLPGMLLVWLTEIWEVSG